ncbi:simple sugar transport system permease protein [Tissierella praeacuta DSM 18095]|uniref:Simple sugar transport system permease protein n=1 Tax=Tissierella praeacuta DSM 18095 TaxID=1123404 RepID=A0A1M4X4T2_9FIRM|nr:ABC transporter [Tissierella praeacuta]TCU65784.1 simple sugar transport system permease protein [Tissierella praeacuta]SHE88494.1 simple sugar transport system permease protein [Tissierella praeacuta DSM 18095]SUO99722.1 autoinducer 2 ABC transporter permease LsrC [Tissierella praeacuta]
MDFKKIYKKIGFPRLIISAFLIVLLIAAAMLNIPLSGIWKDIFTRFGMNAILVLAMVPSIQSGIGINFNLPLGVIFGLIGALISIELGLTGWTSFFVALAIAIPLAVIAGYLYGLMLNKVKGQEMTVGNYVGYSIVSFMCIFWLVAPFRNPELTWAMGGSGLRVTLSLESSMAGLLDKSLNPEWLPEWLKIIPIGLILFFALLAGIVWIFSKSKSGTAMKVAGSSEAFATSNGVNVDRQRLLGIVLSTVLAAIGIIVYSQSFGFLQLYNSPLYVALPAAASILIGGATLQKAKIIHVVIGTFLFQGLLVVALPVINILSEGSMAEIIRIIISNGIILYALTRKAGDAA